jgi:hypothetical protein
MLTRNAGAPQNLGNLTKAPLACSRVQLSPLQRNLGLIRQVLLVYSKAMHTPNSWLTDAEAQLNEIPSDMASRSSVCICAFMFPAQKRPTR